MLQNSNIRPIYKKIILNNKEINFLRFVQNIHKSNSNMKNLRN